ncbi:MAG TPA: hypothetical protein VGI40_18010 [Pirellulaceae bacterium]
MSEKPRDPWEGTELFPPENPPEDWWQSGPAKKPGAGELEEHRAEIIITLAVISLFPIFGLIALAVVAMAWIDLKKMAAGKMDRSGRTQTLVGFWLGLIELFIIAFSIIYFAVRAVI